MTSEMEPVVIKPPADLRSAGSPELWGLLDAAKGKNVALDMSEVESLDAQCLETLLAARKLWAQMGLNVEITDPSDNFRQDAAILGAAELLSLSTEEDEE